MESSDVSCFRYVCMFSSSEACLILTLDFSPLKSTTRYFSSFPLYCLVSLGPKWWYSLGCAEKSLYIFAPWNPKKMMFWLPTPLTLFIYPHSIRKSNSSFLLYLYCPRSGNWEMVASEKQAYRDGADLTLAPSVPLLFCFSSSFVRVSVLPDPLAVWVGSFPYKMGERKFLGKSIGSPWGFFVADSRPIVLFVAETILGTILTTCTTIR